MTLDTLDLWQWCAILFAALLVGVSRTGEINIDI